MKEDAFLSTTLVDLLRLRATSQRSDIAYHFLRDDGSRISITYAQLERRAQAIAATLVRQGRVGERVVLLYPPGLEYIAAFFGCLYAGAIAVPAFPPRPKRPMPRLKAIFVDSAASTVLTTSTLMAGLEQRVRQDAALHSLEWIASDEIPDQAHAQWQRPEITAESLALLQYTSGSTGQPKGVMVSHGNLIHNLATIDSGFGIDAAGMGVTWLPIYHDMGLVGGVLEPMFVGGPAVLFSPVAFLQKPALWLETISEFGGTISGGPNFAYQLCIDRITDAQREKLDLSTWETAYCGAEPIRCETLERFAEVFAPCGFRKESFYPCYGLAEGTLIVTGGHATTAPTVLEIAKQDLARDVVTLAAAPDREATTKEATTKLVSCGQGHLGQQVAIVDPQSRRLLGDRRVGEIWSKGPSVAKGYWGHGNLTRETFQARLADSGDGPYLRTGDLGFLHDGELYVTGRLKDLIIVRGRNHYPQDIEQTVESCHDALRVNGCAAFCIEDELESRLVIVQEIERGFRKQEFGAVLDVIRQAVVRQHDINPSAIVLVKTLSLPKTSSGKGQRHGCRQQYLDKNLAVVAEWNRDATSPAASIDDASPMDRDGGSSASSDEIKQWLVAALSARVGMPQDRIEPARPFENFGIDSMAAIELCADLEAWLGRQVSPALLYEFSNVASLAEHLASRSDALPATAKGTPQRFAEPIAIVGMGCRFPGGVKDTESYWRLLAGGVDAIREVPGDRWDIDDYYDPDPDAPGKMSTRWGGFLNDVDQFDASFFGIAPREARSMDPQQRLLLEVTWEAFEHAGLSPDQLAGSRTGVFTGICNSDYARLLQTPGQVESMDAYYGTGCAFSVTAGRVSYLLGLQGPSLPIDTACSSSLVAVHLACQSLLRDECEVAAAAGVNLLLSPDATVYFSKVRAMAADGRCKTFDASADGYVRGEGCGVVVLKRLSAAVSDGDRILAVIRGSAVNHDGSSNGLTAPNPAAQQEVLRSAMAVAGVDPSDVGYVETHGTGTALGDPIEVRALQAAFSRGRPRERPLMLGAVKTNIGHLEAAAGVAGLIKTVLALQHREIPPLLHFNKLNPEIALDQAAMALPTCATRWQSTAARRVAGVSSFGFSGTNAHVLIEEAPMFAHSSRLDTGIQRLFVLSAKSPQALQDLASAYWQRLQDDDSLRLIDVCHTAGVGRSHFKYRMATVVHSIADLKRKLAGFQSGTDMEGLHLGESKECAATSSSDACELDEVDQSLDTVARQYVAGADVSWHRLNTDLPRHRITLPRYPFQRKRYWLKTPSANQRSENGATPMDEVPSAAPPPTEGAAVERPKGHIRPDLAQQILTSSRGLRPGLILIYLKQQFADAMDVDEAEIAIDEPMTEIGMDSLMAMDVIEAVKQDFNFNLYPREVYQKPTLAALAEYLAGELDPLSTSSSGKVLTDVAAPAPMNLLNYRPSAQPALSGDAIHGGVFILSPPRSGSTLLRVMLAGHPDLFAPPELHLLPFDSMAQRRAVLGDSHLGEGLPRGLMELDDCDAEAAIRQVARWNTDDVPVDEVYRILTQAAAPRLLVDKSPTSAASFETLQRAEAWFTEPKYVLLARHPLAVIESLVRMRFDKLLGDASGDPHELAEQLWRTSLENACRFLDSIDAKRKLVLNFESLVRDPESEMRRLADFLELPYDAAMLAPYSGDRMTDGITASARPIDDPNFLKHDRIEASMADAWQKIRLPKPLSRTTVRLAEQLGYETNVAKNARRDDITRDKADNDTVVSPSDTMMREDTIDAGGLALCRCSWGPQNGPIVVCLHGILDQGAIWQPVAQSLVQQGLRVVAPDLRGHGRSDHAGPGSNYHLWDFVADADAVLRSLGDAEVVLVGHSLGALVAARLAMARPERISRVILVEPPQAVGGDQAGNEDIAQRVASYLDSTAAAAIHPTTNDVATMAGRLQRGLPALTTEFAQLLATRAATQTVDGWTWRWDARLRSRGSLSLADLGSHGDRFADAMISLSMPVTVVWGSQSTHRRRDLSEVIKRTGVDCHTIEGGHHLIIEAPDDVAAIIAQGSARFR